MASQISTGSPKPSHKPNVIPRLCEETGDKNKVSRASLRSTSYKQAAQAPTHSNIVNRKISSALSVKEAPTSVPSSDSANAVNTILAQLRNNDSRKSSLAEPKQAAPTDSNNLNQIISNSNAQIRVLRQQEQDLRDGSSFGSTVDNSMSHSPEAKYNTVYSGGPTMESSSEEESEIVRMKRELEAARSIISRQAQELDHSRLLKHTMDQAMGPASEADHPMHRRLSPGEKEPSLSTFNATARPFTSHSDATWSVMHDDRSDRAFNPHGLGRNRTPYLPPLNTGFLEPDSTYHNAAPYAGRDSRLGHDSYTSPYGNPLSPMDFTFGSRVTSGASTGPGGIDERMLGPYIGNGPHHGMRRNVNQLRIDPDIAGPLSPVLSAGISQSQISHNAPFGIQERVYAAPLSPISPDYSSAGQALIPTTTVNGGTLITSLEPMNYRRLLDKSVSCDWKYIVEKIVCNNDQQASIFLQQKLKVGTAEQKFEIVESIVNQAYPLMINRFGNFLVQRCFEHGTPDQIIAIANAIHGNVISLSMDPFGCHVVQKAFDSIPEDHKSDMVHELLRRIPDTVIHRYACHVWQKLFELRWSGEPPQIMLRVNEALHGMWHEVALGETGSLVVQNIFENCVEEEKRPAIEEVITNIDLISHGQFGNWCIQHLCEHGSPPDKRRVVDHILKNAYNYSIDQFASKVVEKCLKIGGSDFLDRYLSVITTARADRPRIPLIDIAGDQYGNYLIQWILMNAHQHQRDQVGIHIRKHMVSLRGSKFGSRVAMLCSNPAAVTRPGPPAISGHPFGAPNQAAPSSRSQWTRYR